MPYFCSSHQTHTRSALSVSLSNTDTHSLSLSHTHSVSLSSLYHLSRYSPNTVVTLRRVGSPSHYLSNTALLDSNEFDPRTFVCICSCFGVPGGLLFGLWLSWFAGWEYQSYQSLHSLPVGPILPEPCVLCALRIDGFFSLCVPDVCFITRFCFCVELSFLGYRPRSLRSNITQSHACPGSFFVFVCFFGSRFHAPSLPWNRCSACFASLLTCSFR